MRGRRRLRRLRALLLPFVLGALARCTSVDGLLPVTLGPPPPPQVLLEPDSLAAPPVDPRFTDALATYAAAVRDLRAEGADFEVTLPSALRRLANAVALAPVSPAARAGIPSGQRAPRRRRSDGDPRSRGPRARLATAQQALERLAAFLAGLTAREYATSPEVLGAARRFSVATRELRGGGQTLGPWPLLWAPARRCSRRCFARRSRPANSSGRERRAGTTASGPATLW